MRIQRQPKPPRTVRPGSSVVNALALANTFVDSASQFRYGLPAVQVAQGIQPIHGAQWIVSPPWTTASSSWSSEPNMWAWPQDPLSLEWIGRGLVAGATPTAGRNIYSIHTRHSEPSSIYELLEQAGSDPKPGTDSDATKLVAAPPQRTGTTRLHRLTRIQAAFGFPIKTLADTLKRSRTQLYKWLDSNEDVDLQGESLQRLDQITRLAERWLAESSAPLASVAREPLPSGHTITALLSEPVLDDAAILDGFKHLAELARTKPASSSQQLVQRGFERRRRQLPNDD